MIFYGWDVVSALSLEAVNQGLADLFEAHPVNLSFNAGIFNLLDGQFVRWVVVPGGSDSLVHISLNVTGEILTTLLTPQIQTLSATVVVELNLALLPASSGVHQELRFDFQTGAGLTPNQNLASVIATTITSDNFAGVPSNKNMVEGLLGQAVLTCLTSNEQAITYVFATLAEAGNSAQPVPTHSAFQYVETSGGKGYFVILSTVIQPYNNQQVAVDPALFALSPSADSFLGLSDDYFLKYLVLPQLPVLFQRRVTDSIFQVANGKITSLGNINLNEVKSGLIWYQPVVTSVNVALTSGNLQVAVEGSCHVSAGIDVYFSLLTNNIVEVTSSGMCFMPDRHPVIKTSKDISDWIFIGTAFVSLVVDAIVAAVVESITSGIESGLNGTLGFMSMQYISPEFVSWKDYQLNGAIGGQVNGNVAIYSK